MHLFRTAIAVGVFCLAGHAAMAADCPKPNALGTSRIMAVDPAAYPRVGLKSFPQTLPLADKEVVLTFDDGPLPATTTKVLEALAAECVRATFFVVGQNAKAYPRMVQRLVKDGHTVGYHSYSHPNLKKLPYAKALANIDHGIAANQAALSGIAASAAPFFRFPYFDSTPKLLDTLEKRGLAVFGADFWASDWENITPEQELKLVTDRLLKAGRGIILFHDVQARTAAMLPAFLSFLHQHGYRVVHLVPADKNLSRSAARNLQQRQPF